MVSARRRHAGECILYYNVLSIWKVCDLRRLQTQVTGLFTWRISCVLIATSLRDTLLDLLTPVCHYEQHYNDGLAPLIKVLLSKSGLASGDGAAFNQPAL